jgi:formylmethanofuran dehydrogenase subunit E
MRGKLAERKNPTSRAQSHEDNPPADQTSALDKYDPEQGFSKIHEISEISETYKVQAKLYQTKGCDDCHESKIIKKPERQITTEK